MDAIQTSDLTRVVRPAVGADRQRLPSVIFIRRNDLAHVAASRNFGYMFFEADEEASPYTGGTDSAG